MSDIRKPISYFDEGWRRDPERTCLQMADRKYSYRLVREMTLKIASALQARGYGPDNNIAVFSPNDAIGFVCVLSTFRLGSTWVNLNAMNSPDENCRYLNKTDAELIFVHSRFFKFVDQIRAQCSRLREVIGIDKAYEAGGLSVEDLLSAGTEFTEDDFGVEDWDRTCSLFPTGGTTGDPKAVIFTNRMWSAMISTFGRHIPAKSPPVQLLVAPMTHGAGGITMCLMPFGTTHIVMDGFDLEKVMAAVEREKVTHLFLPPTAIYGWLNHPDFGKYDYSSLEFILTGSAPIPAERLIEATDRIGPVVVQTYGQSEAPLMCTCFTSEDLVEAIEKAPHRLKSCGRVTEGTTLEMMDAEGRILAQGETGQIVVKGDLPTPGYYKNPEETAKLKHDGWHLTGDVGYKDEDGFVYIIDRLKEMIITGGFNVFPAEVEQALMGHEAVHECAVFGIPSEKWGEEVRAVVKLRHGQSATEEDLIAFLKEKVGPVRTPKVIEFRDELLKSATGKILRRKIRDSYWKDRDRQV